MKTALQFKINHNNIYTKDKLKKVNLISNDSMSSLWMRNAYN